MGVASALILVANPGSASRKYALYQNGHERAGLHFEWENSRIVCTLHQAGKQQKLPVEIANMPDIAGKLVDLLRGNNLLKDGEHIERIGLRIVAPSSYFLEDRIVDDYFVGQLEEVKSRAPIHITATLEELRALRAQFAEVPIAGVSDSAFHISKPDYAWNYGISLEDADRLEIKRFGYHGLSVASVVRELKTAGKLSPKLVVCHLGSGASVSAVHGGKSLDNTMGYSPLEGLVMSTRSGSIDPTAVRVLKDALHLDDHAAEDYLNNHSGLLGLGGSSDIRELLRREENGDNRARLALATYVYNVQKAVGQMTAALGGIDVLVFTGTVGERSEPMRERIVERLHYLDVQLSHQANRKCVAPESLEVISRLAHSKPVIVVPAREAAEIARRCLL